jgi:hypothetical protein
MVSAVIPVKVGRDHPPGGYVDVAGAEVRVATGGTTSGDALARRRGWVAVSRRMSRTMEATSAQRRNGPMLM